MQQVTCEGCGQRTPGYDVIHYGSMERGYKQLCTRCFNAEVAALCALDSFEHTQFEPVMLGDVDGVVHTFHFRTRLFATGVAIEAFELRDAVPGGYQFSVIGDPQGEPLSLLGRLIEKMRRSLAIKHLEDTDFGVQIANAQDIVRGRIECDDTCDIRTPLLIIDGREITWDEFGRMLMSYEGFQFKLAIHDRSEDV